MQPRQPHQRDRPTRPPTVKPAGDIAARPPVGAEPVETIAGLPRELGNRRIQRLLHGRSGQTPHSAPLTIIQRDDDPNEVLNACLDPDYARTLSDDQIAARLQVLEAQLPALDPDSAAALTGQGNRRMLRVEQARRGLSAAQTAGNAAAFQTAARDLVDFARAEIQGFPALVRRFIDQPAPGDVEKVRILGAVAAAVARMEFLAGTIYHRGGSWENVDSNQGDILRFYAGENADEMPWCSRFATTVLREITGGDVVAWSGYKIANPAEHNLSLNYATRGGAFVGTHSSRNASASAGGNYNPWAELRQTLQRIDSGAIADQTKPEAVEAFFAAHARPQPGDLLITRRSTANPNSFTRDNPATAASENYQSHTQMVERLDGHTLYTIEGNSDSRVRGEPYNLTDPGDVEEIVFIARPGLDSYQPAAEGGAAGGEAAGGAPAGDQVAEADLMRPVGQMNALLEHLAAEMGFVNRLGADQLNVVANLTRSGGGGVE